MDPFDQRHDRDLQVHLLGCRIRGADGEQAYRARRATAGAVWRCPGFRREEEGVLRIGPEVEDALPNHASLPAQPGGDRGEIELAENARRKLHVLRIECHGLAPGQPQSTADLARADPARAPVDGAIVGLAQAIVSDDSRLFVEGVVKQ
jgi:hypothetical protein